VECKIFGWFILTLLWYSCISSRLHSWWHVTRGWEREGQDVPWPLLLQSVDSLSIIMKMLVPQPIRTRHFPTPYHCATPLDNEGGNCGNDYSDVSIFCFKHKWDFSVTKILAPSSTADMVMKCALVYRSVETGSGIYTPSFETSTVLFPTVHLPMLEIIYSPQFSNENTNGHDFISVPPPPKARRHAMIFRCTSVSYHLSIWAAGLLQFSCFLISQWCDFLISFVLQLLLSFLEDCYLQPVSLHQRISHKAETFMQTVVQSRFEVPLHEL
jgi:hypothetical protein